MKDIFLALTLSTALLLSRPSSAQDASPIEGTKAEVSYSAGVKLVDYLQHNKDLVDLEIFIKGIRDAFDEKELSMDEEDIENTFTKFQRTVNGEHRITMKEVGEQFLRSNAHADGVVVRESGLQYKVLVEGSGPIPSATDRVRTHYKGALLDGTLIDNTYLDDRPADIGVYQVFPGWAEALQLMPVGSKWRLFIPSDLAYGEKGAGKKIPPHSVVIFEVEPLKILLAPLKGFK